MRSNKGKHIMPRAQEMNIWFRKSIFVLLIIHIHLSTVAGRKHHLEVKDDIRPYIALSTFGFYSQGHLDVKLSKLLISKEQEDGMFGLSLDRTTIDQINPYLDSHQNKCILEEPSIMQRSGPILFFLLDIKNLQVKVQCSPEWRNMHIYKDRSLFPMFRGKRQLLYHMSERRKRQANIAAQDDDHGMLMEEAEFDASDESMEEPVEPIKSSSQIAPWPAAAVENTENAAKDADAVHDNANNPIKTAAVAKESLKVDSKQAVADVVDKSIKPAVVAPPRAPVPAPANNGGRFPVDESDESNLLDAAGDSVPAAAAPAPAQVAVSVPKSKESKHTEEQWRNAANAIAPVVNSAKYGSNEYMQNQLCKDFILPLTKTVVDGQTYYNMSFAMLVASLHDEGLYNLYFHACPNYRQPRRVSFVVDIEENNNGNYLSAGEMPLPALYSTMSLLFFLSGLFWVFILKKSKHSVYKIHYIMAVLVFLKSLSLMFHAINYHFIQQRGEHVEAWAILYYIAHLLKGAVLFITIVLIGTGWTFIKHILSDKDKKIFMIVIPLQVLANVAEIIIDESEESDIEFRTWRNIFIFVDLLCCGAILFPIVWSIRHLHEASATDGKAAINLRKLKLFRQFYIMIVCYIYFTRIIVYLLKMTVAFQYAWLDEMFHEMATYVFFVLTGYKFRPTSSHPYFAVGDEDPDDDEVEVLTESGLTEGLRHKVYNRNAPPSKTIIIEGNDEEERETLISKRESSHEYD